MTTDQGGPPPPIRLPDRLDPEIFQLPVDKMRAGYYSDKYFVRARDVLLHHGRDPHVTMQVFQKRHAFVAGTDEAKDAVMDAQIPQTAAIKRDMVRAAMDEQQIEAAKRLVQERLQGTP